MSGINYRISFGVFDSSGIKIGEIEFTVDGITADIEKDLSRIKKAMNSIKEQIQGSVKSK